MLYGTECWMVKHQYIHKINVIEMRMLRWMCGHTRNDKVPKFWGPQKYFLLNIIIYKIILYENNI